MWRLRKKNYRGGEMREIIDYTVICSDKLTALKERVVTAIEVGWQPLGKSSDASCSMGVYEYRQTMVKYAPKPNYVYELFSDISGHSLSNTISTQVLDGWERDGDIQIINQICEFDGDEREKMMVVFYQMMRREVSGECR